MQSLSPGGDTSTQSIETGTSTIKLKYIVRRSKSCLFPIVVNWRGRYMCLFACTEV